MINHLFDTVSWQNFKILWIVHLIILNVFNAWKVIKIYHENILISCLLKQKGILLHIDCHGLLRSDDAQNREKWPFILRNKVHFVTYVSHGQNRPCGEGKYQSMDNTKNRNRMRKLLPKKWRDLQMKGTNKHKEA